MYQEIRNFFKERSEVNRSRMAKAIKKSLGPHSSGTITDLAKAWLEAKPEDVPAIEEKLKGLLVKES
jgi:hypothetical protein